MSSTSSCSRRHLSVATDSIGWKSTLLSRGRVRVRVVICGDKKVRIDEMATQPSPFVNLNEVSLGRRGSSVDHTPKKEVVSRVTSAKRHPPK